MNYEKYIISVASRARKAALELAVISTAKKNKALKQMAEDISKNKKHIQRANEKDLISGRKKKLSEALLDRLTLTDQRINDMCDGLRQIACLKDPVGQCINQWKTPHGLLIQKVKVPIGVIAIIYESRPNVTADSSALCVKSGNVVILRGGSEAIHSNMMIADILSASCKKAGLPTDTIQLIKYTDRALMKPLLVQNESIDLVIPRGGEGLIRFVTENSTIPVIKHYNGICHVYVDKNADITMAKNIIVNAKTQRPGVCNAIETVLVHKDIAQKCLQVIADALREKDVEIRGDMRVRKVVKGVKPVTAKDWDTEYLDLILSVGIVNNINDAIAHINTHGSKHSDTIVTKNKKAAQEFLSKVDSSAVFHNASTRFNDGGQFGFGAEIGISTDKIHARGPMGLNELTTYKYLVMGNGQIRS
ncbi:MAG: glutamate-5-semialdehyde dehydrogenase [Candidatus Ancaeobacter aquaticus]|nr:glutamate-5-semialdehyde dehydrogenase [Candidatus Ancaeobacter aquaticus]